MGKAALNHLYAGPWKIILYGALGVKRLRTTLSSGNTLFLIPSPTKLRTKRKLDKVSCCEQFMWGEFEQASRGLSG